MCFRLYFLLALNGHSALPGGEKSGERSAGRHLLAAPPSDGRLSLPPAGVAASPAGVARRRRCARPAPGADGGGGDGVGFSANGVASPLLSATSLNPPPGKKTEGTAMSEELLLSERNVPRASLHDELTKLYSQGFLTDITLSTEDGKNFEAHRVLLAARSHYFHSVIPRLKTDAVIFLKGVKGAHLDKASSVSLLSDLIQHICLCVNYLLRC
jgi:hypothetical protein